MKVKELIGLLQLQDLEMTVCVDGYEGGVTEKLEVILQRVKLNANKDWYYGEHEQMFGDEDSDTTVLVLGRTSG